MKMEFHGCRRSVHQAYYINRSDLEKDDEDEIQRRRRALSKNQIVKRLRLSFYDWSNRRNRLSDRRTTAKESTVALLKKIRLSQQVPNPAHAVDPITREKINEGSDNVFSFRRGSATARINASALIDYILSTNDYCDPESRIPFEDSALAELDRIGVNLGKPSVLKARKELEAKFAERQFLRDAVCGLERVCGESVTQMFELVEKVNDDLRTIEDAQVQLLTYIVPEFQSNFSQLVAADKSIAKHSSMHFEAFLQGPPNRPAKKTAVQLLVMELFQNAVEDATNVNE